MDFSAIQGIIENAVTEMQQYFMTGLNQVNIPELESLQGTIQESTTQLEEMNQQLEMQKQIAYQNQNNVMGNKVMKNIKTSFNLKKAKEAVPQMDPMGLNESPELIGDQMDQQSEVTQEMNENPQFQDGADLRDWLDSRDALSARGELLNYVQDINAQQLIEDYLDQFYQGDVDSNEKIKIASNIYDLLPSNIKVPDVNTEGFVPATYRSAEISESEEEIKKLAKQYSNEKHVKPFNLNKTAQQKSIDTSVIMYGPDQMRIDPFYRQPVSDYLIMERNKGTGLVVGDVWNIDWESIWRGTIMDKYSRPYRDNDGNWVGGYIQKRFEVDKNIPVTSNLQLKPGQKRKPILPEYGNIGTRLEAAREKGEIAGEPVVAGEVFNWKEASSKKKS
jgi:hypothetical protein